MGLETPAHLTLENSEMNATQIIKPKIVSIKRDVYLGSCTLYAGFDNGKEDKLFSFYIDELTFDESDLIGLTEDEAHQLRHQRDVAFLRS